jgi:hypothetical protein
MSLDNFYVGIQIVLEFIVPGFIANFVYNKLLDSKEKDKISDNLRLLSCVCISYVLNLIFGLFISNLLLRVAIETAVGIVLAVLLIKLLGIRKVRHWYSKINHTMLSESVLESLGLYQKDQYVSVFLKSGSMVYGRIISFNDEDDPWIALDCYRTAGDSFSDKKDPSSKLDEWNKTEEKSINNVIAIRLDEIRAISHHKNTAGKGK